MVTADSTLSAAPNPPPPLSGLLFAEGLAGAPQQVVAGQSLSQAGGLPGQQPGPGLDLLQLLLLLSQGQGGALPGAVGQLAGGGGIGGSLEQGLLGQQGGIQSPTFQTIGQQGVAGQSSPTPSPTSQAGGSADPLAFLQKLFGLGSTVSQLGTQVGQTSQTPQAPTQGGFASPTVGDQFGPGGGPLASPDILSALASLSSNSPLNFSSFEQLPQGQNLLELFGIGVPSGGGGGGGGTGLGLTQGITEGPGGNFLGGGTGLGLTQGVLEGGAANPPVGGGFDLSSLPGLFTLLGGATGLARGAQAGDPLSILGSLGKLAPTLAQLSNTQFGTSLPTSITDVLSQLGGGGQEASNLLGSLSQSFGGLGGAALPLIGSLLGGAFGGGDFGRTAFNAGTGALTGLLGNLAAEAIGGQLAGTLAGAGLGGAGGAGVAGAAGAGALGAGAASAGIGLAAIPAILGLTDIIFNEDKKRRTAGEIKDIAGALPTESARALSFLQNPTPVFPEGADIGFANSPQRAQITDLLGNLLRLQQIQTFESDISQSGRREQGLKFPDSRSLRPLADLAGQVALQRVIASQQAVQQAGVTPEVLQAGGFPLQFSRGQVVNAPGFGVQSLQPGPSAFTPFLDNPTLRQFANIFGLQGALPNLGGPQFNFGAGDVTPPGFLEALGITPPTSFISEASLGA